MYPVKHKIKNKDKETSKSKKNEKNKTTFIVLNWNPHLLSAKTHLSAETLIYPLGYRGILINFYPD